VQLGLAAPPWLTVSSSPPIVTVPLRAAPVFAATFRVTLPLPIPLAPALTVIQDAFDVAVHAQPAGAVTMIGAPAPPADESDCVVGLMMYEHPWAFCVTVIV
jgi:hypothetical protein